MTLKAVIENNPQSCQLQKIAENLRALLKKHHLNANQLAQELSIPKMTIGRLLSGETTDPRISTLKLISDYFNVPLDYLIEADEQTIVNALKQNQPHLVPKLDWDTVQKINNLSDLDLTQWETYQSIFLKEQQISKNAFALKSRPSMYPRFPQDTLFIIDPDMTPRDGDIVLVKLKSHHELTLRELIIDPPEWQLHPLVSNAAILHYSKTDHQIIGVNILTMLYNRKGFG